MTSAVEEELIELSPVSIRGAGTTHRKHDIEPATLEELAIIVEKMPQAAPADDQPRHLVPNGVIKVRRAVTFTSKSTTAGPPKTKAGRDSLLFPAESGGHLHESVVFRHWNASRKAAGRPELPFHDLRHTGATFAAQAGATTAELQARPGHATADAAMIYQHAAKGRDRVLAERLSELAV